jgi:hypothetical protein
LNKQTDCSALAVRDDHAAQFVTAKRMALV